MTQILKEQLTTLVVVSLCGGAFLWGVGALRAQDYFDFNAVSNSASEAPNFQEPPRPKLTRDEAAKKFTAAMLADYLDFDLLRASVSLKSRQQLAPRSGASRLMRIMSEQWKSPNQTVKVQSQNSRTATVVVQQISTTRPLVLIQENGSWGVDLVETYVKWTGLQGVAKAEAIYKNTGVILDGLPRTEKFKRDLCQSNLKQIALGITQYVQDWDEKFPPAEKIVDVLQPYVKSEEIFNCPALPKTQKYGYAFNSKLADKIDNGSFNTIETVSLYETSILKRNVFGTGENLAFRHQKGANYAFADGHVKWFPKTQIPSFKLKP